MAAQPADIARLDAVLKDRPLVDAVQDALNKATPFAERITQELTLSGRKGIFPAQFGVNEAVYMRGDGEAFGDAKSNEPKLAEVFAKYMYAIFEITGPVMSATRDNPGAFEDALALSIQNTIDGVKLHAGRKYIGRGDGVWALFQAATDNNEFDIRNPYAIDTQGETFSPVTTGVTKYKGDRPVRHIVRIDQALDILDQATPTTKHGNNVTVGAVVQQAALTEIDLAGADTYDNGNAAEGDWITIAGDYNKDIQGFLEAVRESGTYLNIDRTGREGWQGVLVDVTDGGTVALPLDPNDLRDSVDLVTERSAHPPQFMVGTFKMRRNVYNLSAPQIRHMPVSADQGLKSSEPLDDTVTFDGMRFIVERFFPPQHIGLVNTDFWYHGIDKDVEWIQGQGGTVLHFLLTADKYRAVLRTFRNLVCLFPAAQGLVYGVEE